MKSIPLNFKQANKYLSSILLIGIALGVANFSLGFWPTLGQSLLQQVLISFIIGYSLLLVVTNASQWFSSVTSDINKYLILLACFFFIGLLGAEVESLVKSFLFQQTEYHLFNSGSYLFNGILSSILGFSFYNWLFQKEATIKEAVIQEQPIPEILHQETPLTTIPIKQGEKISLHPLSSVLYFEAYDNYSFLFDREGNKQLCNYSLIYLEKKLPANFLRIHRKYLINKEQLLQIQPHFKGRYVLTFKDKGRSVLTSSTSYSDVIKQLTKL